MSKKKQSSKRDQQRREKRKAKAKKRQTERRRDNASPTPSWSNPDPLSPFWPEEPAPEHLPPARLDLPAKDKLLPAVYIDASGQTVRSPHQTLALAAGERDPSVIRDAWRHALIAHPPETDPEGSRQIREARDLLIDPKRVIERELGALRLPDAEAWDLPELEPDIPQTRLGPAPRLVGEAVLYALVEDELWTHTKG